MNKGLFTNKQRDFLFHIAANSEPYRFKSEYMRRKVKSEINRTAKRDALQTISNSLNDMQLLATLPNNLNVDAGFFTNKDRAELVSQSSKLIEDIASFAHAWMTSENQQRLLEKIMIYNPDPTYKQEYPDPKAYLQAFINFLDCLEYDDEEINKMAKSISKASKVLTWKLSQSGSIPIHVLGTFMDVVDAHKLMAC